jgi:hypothetical protein
VSVLRKKYQLPTTAHLPQIKIDLKRLQDELDSWILRDKFVDVITANPTLCMNHKELVKDVYDNFEQINLTDIDGEVMEYTSDVKERIRRREERLYNKPTEDYNKSYFKEIVDQFKDSAMRVRITRLAPHQSISWHIDYDPSYATRIIIPIFSNDKVENWFRVKGEEINTILEPGKAYFLNTGFAHAVTNNGSLPRMALMFSLDGQSDIDDI